MHIHLPLVLEAIVFSWIALYWLIYKILLRNKLSPLLVSLLKQPPRSRYYEWARKKQMYVVLFIFAYIMSALILLKVNKLI